MGDAGTVAKSFFDRSIAIANLEGDIVAKPSSDGFLLGIQFQGRNLSDANLSRAHFRLPNCQNSGKAEILNDRERAAAVILRGPASIVAKRFPASIDAENGFDILDKNSGGNYPTFSMRDDYSNARAGASDRPWKGMDISNKAGAFEFAEAVQAYFYDGMANQHSNADQNFVASSDTTHYWCHMPWLNVGDSGREAIHGLTKERDILPSTIYPAPGTGSDWGIGFYNAVGCQTIGSVFGNSRSSGTTPNWNSAKFPDGTMSAKILFTTANFPALNGSFSWNAHVSGPKQTERQVTSVRHLQMDIAVRDSSLKGTIPGNRNWVMVTYYYDTSYTAADNSPLRRIANLPAAFLHMRPMGVQVGFETPNTILFDGAKTNQVSSSLNGPADNPKSSCLGCHGTAGTHVAMAPGFTSNAMYSATMASTPSNLDFSQQLALAKRNAETQPK